ncbi:THUMP domain-containing protein 1 isoform X4 [Nilaparvata lugens]|uniref:THUMP domain-containing protein 1 isoform X4 n=1 Tax=Nilaparvata lugens TaxID=108931 RepID=UPI00193D6F86|nr:THUMP domain-containing protein 1 isoform X4 [Nilaparvata lugens]
MALSVDINGALYILHKIFQKWILKKVDDEYVIENDAEIEDELEREVKSLKKSTKSGERRFQVVESGANCCVFIKAKIPDPVKLAATIMEDVASTKTQKTRYLIRLLPVEVTCKAYMDSIKKAADSLFDKYFKCEPTTFAIVYNKRNNDNLLRDEVIQSLAVLVEDKNILHKVDLRQARLTVVVEVIKSICCLSVVPDFFKYCKYNLMQLSKDDDSANGNADKTPASGATEKENEEKLCKSTEESRSAELSDKNCETVTDISKAGDNVAPDDSVPVIQKT